VKSSAKAAMTLSTSQLYDETSHKKPNGYYYDSNSTKVPRYYNRVGPASYQADRTLASDSRLQKLDKHKKSPGQVIGNQDFPRGAYQKTLDHHRFIDYSK